MAAVFKISWQGNDHVFDPNSISAREYKVIKRHTGLRMGQFERALMDANTEGLDVEVIDCLLFLALKRSGQDVDPATLPDYIISEIALDVIEDEDEAAGPKD